MSSLPRYGCPSLLAYIEAMNHLPTNTASPSLLQMAGRRALSQAFPKAMARAHVAGNWLQLGRFGDAGKGLAHLLSLKCMI